MCPFVGRLVLGFWWIGIRPIRRISRRMRFSFTLWPFSGLRGPTGAPVPATAQVPGHLTDAKERRVEEPHVDQPQCAMWPPLVRGPWRTRGSGPSHPAAYGKTTNEGPVAERTAGRSTGPDGRVRPCRSALSLGPMAFQCLITSRPRASAFVPKKGWPPPVP